MRRSFWILFPLAILAACSRPMTVEQAKGVAITVASTGSMVPPRRLEDMTKLLSAQAGTESTNTSAWRSIADAQPPDKVKTGKLILFLYKRAEAAWELGRFRQARDDFRQALDLAMGKNPDFESELLLKLGKAEQHMGNVGEALALFERARQSGAPLKIYNNLLRLYISIGDMNRAREALDMGLAQVQREDPKGNKEGIQRVADDLRATYLEGQGRWKEAEPLLRKTLAFLRERPDRVVEAILSSQNLSHNLRAQGRLVDAELEARQALQAASAKADREPGLLAGAALNLGDIALAQGRLAETRKLAEAIASLLVRAGYPAESNPMVQARRMLGKVDALLGDFSAAAVAFSAVLDGVRHDAVLRRRIIRSEPLLPLTLLLVGRIGEAQALSAEAYDMAAAQMGPASALAAQFQAVRGAAKARQGLLEEAFADLSAAIPCLAGRGGESGSSGKTISGRLLAGEWIGLLHRLYATPLEAKLGVDALDLAFRAAESAGSKTVRGALAAQGARAAGQDPALAELARQEQDLAMYMEAAQVDLLAVAGADGGSGLRAARDHLEELGKARQALRDEISRRFPQYSELVAPQGCGVRDAQSALRLDEALVSIFPGVEQTFVWCIPAKGEPGFHVAPVGRRELERRVAALRRGLEISASTLAEIPSFDLDLAYALYHDLLQPVEAGFKSASTLLVVLRPPLDRLPLGVLVTAAADPGQDRSALFDRYRRVPWLITRQAVDVIPSAESLRGLRSLPPGAAARKALAGFGDPFFSPEQERVAAAETTGLASRGVKVRSVRAVNRGSLDVAGVQADLSQLDRLPDTRDELLEMAAALGADAKADLFLGKDASRSRVLGMDLRDRRVLAFATHALVPGDLDGLDQPALALSASAVTGVAGDGLLTMEDVLRLRLAADWVVLSACNTGAADGAGAEAVSGLGRAFFYAGARALLVSMWPVETFSARQLTTGLFAAQAKEPSLSRAQALRRSMLGLMNGPGLSAEDGRQAVFAHPFFWAPFVLVGEGGGAAK